MDKNIDNQAQVEDDSVFRSDLHTADTGVRDGDVGAGEGSQHLSQVQSGSICIRDDRRRCGATHPEHEWAL